MSGAIGRSGDADDMVSDSDSIDSTANLLDAQDVAASGDVPFIEKFSIGTMTVHAGKTILTQGQQAPQQYAVNSGVGLRFQTLPDGARRTYGFVLPGDMIGFQSDIQGQLNYGIEAASTMNLSVFDRGSIWEMMRNEPAKTYPLIWKISQDSHYLNAGLSLHGQQAAPARMAWALLHYYRRIMAVSDTKRPTVSCPFRQQDMADILGLSLVHTNKTLASLRAQGLVTWKDGLLTVSDEAGLAAIAGEI